MGKDIIRYTPNNPARDRNVRNCLLFTASWLLLLSGCGTMPQIVITKDVLTSEEHARLGLIYESKGETENAISEYRKAIEKDKNYATAYFNLGNIYLKNGQYDKAENY